MARFRVTLTLETDDDDATELVKEAVESLLDNELLEHQDGGTSCGVSFVDAEVESVERLEE